LLPVAYLLNDRIVTPCPQQPTRLLIQHSLLLYYYHLLHNLRFKQVMLPPEKIYNMLKFAKDLPETNASKLYQPYYGLLSHLSPPEEEYFIFLQYTSLTQFSVVDHRTIYSVNLKTHLSMMFLLQVKSSQALGHRPTGQEADWQIRKKFRHVIVSISVEMLYRASPSGTLVCIYKLHFMSRVLFAFPMTICSNLEIVTDTVPIECWKIALLTRAGHDQLFKTLQNIKEMSTTIC